VWVLLSLQVEFAAEGGVGFGALAAGGFFQPSRRGFFVSLVGKKDKNVAFHVGKTDKKPYICIGKTDKRMLKRKIDSYLEQFYERTNNFAMTM